MTDQTRVLYVDDNSNSLEVRAMMLEECDIDVVTETNVEDARRRLAEGDIDCVLSDLDMPDEDGFDLLEYVQDTHPELPFILFTSHESEDVIERALDSGATDYFPKSLTNVSYRLLAHRIEQAARIAESEQAIAAGVDTRAGEPEAKPEIGVPQTEIDPTNRKPRAEIEDWGWEQSGETAGATVKTDSSTELEHIEEGPTVVVSDGTLGETEPMADEPEWEITSETRDALQWLDSHERRLEAERFGSRGEDGETGAEPDEFIYPVERKTADAQAEATDEKEPAEESVDEAIDIVGTADIEAGTAKAEGTAGIGDSTLAASTEKPVPTVAEPSKVSPIPGVAPPSAGTGAREPKEPPSESDESDERRVTATGAGGGDSEEGLAGKINLGTDTDSDVSPATGDQAGTERTEGTPADAQPIPSVALGPEPGMESALETEPEPGSEPTPEREIDPESETDPSAHEHDHTLLEGFDPEPGEGVLVECSSQDGRKGHACLDLLGLDNVEGRNVLLIRYRQIGADRLRRIAEDAEDVHLISIGYRQSIPNDIEELVETTRINNPDELTRLGIVMTRVIGNWDTDSFETVVCLDSLDILLGYKDGRSVFRFLHVLLSKLQSADAISHFHIEPSRGGDQSADTLKPLFDSVVTIDDDGVHIE